MALQHLRSSTAHKRPIPTQLSAGQIAVNTNEASPGLFFKDSNGDLVKIGPVHVGENAPNSSPASTAATAIVSGTTYQILTVGTTDFTAIGASANTVGTIFTATGVGTGTGTVSGQQGVEKGEQWLDTTGGTYVLKIYDGSAWRSESGTFVDSAGDTMTGALLLDNAASASAPDLSFDGDANTGIYSPGADQVAIATGGVGRLFVDSNGDVKIEDTSTDSSAGPEFSLYRNSASPADGDYLGQIRFDGENDTGGKKLYAKITGKTSDVTNGTEDGLIETAVIKAGSQTIVSRQTSTDLKLINGTGLQVDGNVGIGTASPSRSLHVSGTTTNILRLENTSADVAGIELTGTGGTSKIFHDGGDIRFLPNNSDAVRIDSSGNVGVGTTSPTHRLTVSEDSATTNAELAIDYTGSGSGRTAMMRFQRGGTNFAYIAGATAMLTSGNFDDLGIAPVSGKNLIFGIGPSEKARIDSSGNVGIGTTSPTDKLNISSGTNQIGLDTGNQATYGTLDVGHFTNGAFIGTQAGSNSASDVLRLGTSGTTKLQINSNGNVGIGTTSPSVKLTVQDDSLTSTTPGTNIVARFQTNGSGRDASILLGDAVATASRIGQTSGNITFHPGSATEKVRIDSSGRLLVGTTSSSTGTEATNCKLVVAGNTVSGLSGAGLLNLQKGTAAAATSYVGRIIYSDNTHDFAYIDSVADGSTTAGRLVFSTTASGGSSPTTRFTLNRVGDAVFSNTSAVYPATDNAATIGGSSNRWSAVWAANGTIQTSDERLKTEIANSSLATDFVKSLRPVSYKWIEGGKRHTGEYDEDNNFVYETIAGNRTHWGFIAQEVKQSADDAGVDFGGWVLEDKDDADSTQSLRYDQFIAPLTAALQEAIAKIETLEAKVAALEAG